MGKGRAAAAYSDDDDVAGDAGVACHWNGVYGMGHGMHFPCHVDICRFSLLGLVYYSTLPFQPPHIIVKYIAEV